MFVFSAMMEWQTDHQPQVPRNILELCMKGQHATDPGFIKTYTSFLTSTGDVPNARATFERALSQAQCPLGMWDAFVEVSCMPSTGPYLPCEGEEGENIDSLKYACAIV